MRAAPALLTVTVLLAACAENEAPADPLDGLELVGEDPTELPLPGLDSTWRARFNEGDAIFATPFRSAEGLGPLYIRSSCEACHRADSKGPGKVTKMVVVEADGVTPAADQSLLPFGHTERGQLVAPATTPIRAPADTSVKTSTRLGPAVFGRGYLEAIRDDEIERIEAEQAQRTDGVSGRIHRVPWRSEANPEQPFHRYGPGDAGLIGRFGVKARIATLDDFSADAFQGDMGMTSPLRPLELANPDGLADDAREGIDLDSETVNAAADYVRLIRMPSREAADPKAAALFEKAQCSICHVPSLRTRDDYPIAQLAGIDAPVYTDLLLHDMGVELADSLPEGDASGGEWRTAPLIGLRHLRSYLHDGRASTVEEAILLHRGTGSEANASVDAYEALSSGDRALLLDFVESL